VQNALLDAIVHEAMASRKERKALRRRDLLARFCVVFFSV
jgi:hypothetical protein